ncbi:MAG: peptide chain release factor N(5)-glutamine methyltransferase [Thermoanaerobaculum sp.]|nr:peptide chain release factor N(5)-glutamine methyltransferase [Thermoanaerobaculum sp.]MDW7967556.1 peptide chain release factor N(5)-glutamine methyltransferase [Thermoanaerobaculum sp.]
MTIGELLAWARQRLVPREGMRFPEREARAFLAWLLHTEEARILAHPERAVEEAVARQFYQFVQRRSGGEPFHLILGWCPFYGRQFAVAPGVLIPRPETELVVQAVLRLPLPSQPRILDVGTGSGVLAITLALELPQAQVWASDTSWGALQVARRNAARLHARVRLALAHLARPWCGGFHLVVANLPYVPESLQGALPPELAFEDPAALFGGPDGLALIRPLVADLPRLLVRRGFAALELGPGQAEVLASHLPTGLEPQDLVYDLGGTARVLVLRRT